MSDPLPIFIGFDSREQQAYDVCRYSLVENSSVPLRIMPLKHRALRKMGLFDRPWRIDEQGQYWDERDGLPFSTEFSFTRFLVPALAAQMGITGWAMFVDCDFLFRADVADLFALADPSKAVMVVKHDHQPREDVKMDGMQQVRSVRKNWSSLMLWNLDDHHSCRPSDWEIKYEPGWWLHGFKWCPDTLIGDLPLSWNWLAGYSEPLPKVNAVHFTLGTPDMEGYGDQPYAAEWWATIDRMKHPRPSVAARMAAA